MVEIPSIFVISSNDAVRDAVARLVRSEELHVEAYRTPDEFLLSYDPARPGCIVLDVQSSAPRCSEMPIELATRGGFTPVIFLSDSDDVQLAVQAMKNQAFDFLLRSGDASTLLTRIRQAVELDAYIRHDRASQQDVAVRLARLSSREREVFDLVISGMANKQIAARLGLSEKTIEFHRAKLKKKLRAESTADLVRMSILAGPHSGRRLAEPVHEYGVQEFCK